MDITGSSAIVTGGASGIGAAVARALAAKGAIVVVADLNAEKGEALAAEIGGVFAAVDVTRTEQVAAAVEAAAEIAPLRACVNSAGIGWAQRTIGRDGMLESAHDLDAFRKVVEINLIGTFDMTRQAATVMSRSSGSGVASGVGLGLGTIAWSVTAWACATTPGSSVATSISSICDRPPPSRRAE